MPPNLAQLVADLPSHLPAVYEKPVDLGVLSRVAPEGCRPLLELLYGIITPTPTFEKKVALHLRNGSTPEEACYKAMALYPGTYRVEFPGWFQALLANNATPGHVLQRTTRVRGEIEGYGLQVYNDLDATRLPVWLQEQRRTQQMGSATCKHYVKAMRSFAKWLQNLMKRGYMRNPFAAMRLLNEQVDIRRRRRMRSDEEMARLLTAARQGRRFLRLMPNDRAMLYEVALTLGLRARELASLTPEQFTFGPGGASADPGQLLQAPPAG